MASLNNPGVMIQVRVDEDTKFGKYTDALYFTAVEYAALSNADVRQLGRDRAKAWVDMIDARPPRAKRSRNEALEAKAMLQQQLAQVDQELAEPNGN